MVIQQQMQKQMQGFDNPHRSFFKAFSNETRLNIISLLRLGPLTVSKICEKSGFEQSRVSHNLRCLENCGFVNVSQKGNFREYSLDEETIIPIVDLFEKHIEKYKVKLGSCEVLS